jgi:RNA binding exosome subunit
MAKDVIPQNLPTDIRRILETDELDQLRAYRELYDAIVKDGKILTVKELQDKAKAGLLTAGDSITSRLYIHGIIKDNMASFIKFPAEDIEKIKKLYSAFPDASKGKGEAIRTIEGYEDVVKKFKSFFKKSKFSNQQFDSLLDEIIDSTAELKQKEIPNIGWLDTNHLKPFRKIDGVKEKLLAGEILVESAGTGTRILGEIDGKPIINTILSGIKNIENPNLKRAAVIALFGQRGEALLNMKTSFEAASKFKGKLRPWYDPKTGIIHNPTDKKDIKEIGGRKRLPPTIKVGPLLKHILDQQFIASGGRDDLFPDLRPNDLATELNKVVHKSGGISNYPEEIVEKLGREPTGYTDLRRIFASVSINEIANRETDLTEKKRLRLLADRMLGHNVTKKMNLDDLDATIGDVMEGHYATVKGGTVNVADNKLPILMEQFLAEAMEAVNQKGELRSNILAAKISIKVPANFGHTYSNTVEANVVEKLPSDAEKSKVKTITQEVQNNIEQAGRIDKQKLFLEEISNAEEIEEGIDKLEKKGYTIGPNNEIIPPERPVKLSEKEKKFKSLLNWKNKKDMLREVVGDISQNIDEGVDRITSKETYIEAGERLLDPEEWKQAGKQLIPLASQFVPKPLKLVGKAGKMLMPGSRLEGSAEASIEAVDTATRTYREEMQAQLAAREAAEMLGDVEAEIEKSPEDIGDNRLETTEERINRQMMEVGFGS